MSLDILLLGRGRGDGREESPDLVSDDLHGHALRKVPLRVLQVCVRRAARQMFQREEMEICPVKKSN